MNIEETIDFLKENGHTIMLWVKKGTLFDALKVMVSTQDYIKALNNFYGINVVQVYWTYTQMTDEEQEYIAQYSEVKHRYIKMMATRRK